jgi:hypothetical protein
MFDLLIAAALAEASINADAEPIAPMSDPLASSEIRVEAPRRVHSWQMPELDVGAAEACTSWWEGQLPGFGTISFGPSCAGGDSDASINDPFKGELP